MYKQANNYSNRRETESSSQPRLIDERKPTYQSKHTHESHKSDEHPEKAIYMVTRLSRYLRINNFSVGSLGMLQ